MVCVPTSLLCGVRTPPHVRPRRPPMSTRLPSRLHLRPSVGETPDNRSTGSVWHGLSTIKGLCFSLCFGFSVCSSRYALFAGRVVWCLAVNPHLVPWSLGCTHRLNRASRRIVDSTAQRQVSHAARNIRRSGITSMRRSTATTSSSLPPNHRSTSTIDSSCSSSGTGPGYAGARFYAR